MTNTVETMDTLPGEGETRTTTEILTRATCDECGEPAHFKHSYLLEGNARNNPASSAYRRDDCSWCEDEKRYTCRTCKRPSVDGYSWCSTFPAKAGFKHMFLTWVEK